MSIEITLTNRLSLALLATYSTRPMAEVKATVKALLSGEQTALILLRGTEVFHFVADNNDKPTKLTGRLKSVNQSPTVQRVRDILTTNGKYESVNIAASEPFFVPESMVKALGSPVELTFGEARVAKRGGGVIVDLDSASNAVIAGLPGISGMLIPSQYDEAGYHMTIFPYAYAPLNLDSELGLALQTELGERFPSKEKITLQDCLKACGKNQALLGCIQTIIDERYTRALAIVNTMADKPGFMAAKLDKIANPRNLKAPWSLALKSSNIELLHFVNRIAGLIGLKDVPERLLHALHITVGCVEARVLNDASAEAATHIEASPVRASLSGGAGGVEYEGKP